MSAAADMRRPYLEQVRAESRAQRLREQVGWISLCGWCRYFYDPGPSYEYPDEDNTDCDHPQAHDEYGPGFVLIRRARVNTERVADGADCWAFRPKAGACNDRFRDTTPDHRYPGIPHRQVPGSRLVELMALAAVEPGTGRGGASTDVDSGQSRHNDPSLPTP